VVAEKILPWREVSPLQPLNGAVRSLLDTVDSLRSAWQRAVDGASPEEFAEARRRSLRRHAVETGIIERLYDVDWGVTEALVAEGLTLEAAQAQGSINPDTLKMIRSQFDALDYLADVARGQRPLTVQLVRELHQLITRQQATYEATDPLGNHVETELHHGQWKRWPNHVRRPDGSLLEYAPPEQVEHQVQRLVKLHRGMDDVHPVVRAAWLHHRFICIHPFEDGNGRVARALVLLDLLKGSYAPLVVDRTRRDDYLAALDAANEGDIARLVRLFSELEIVALRFELHQPAEAPTGSAVTVARAYVERIRRAREAPDAERRRLAVDLAGHLHRRMTARLETLASDLAGTFRELDPGLECRVSTAVPGDERASWWRLQLIRSAREVNFWTNLNGGTWWVWVRLTVLGRAFRYVAAVQRVGDRDVGVMAVTVFAEMPQRGTEREEESSFVPPVPLIRLSSADSVTLVGGQLLDEVWPEVEALIDRTLAASVHEYGKQLG
jgi:Fic family protein